MDSSVQPHTCATLRRAIERSLGRAFDPAEVLPRLARLADLAPAGSEDGVFANRQLAELLVERQPWRAALHARRVLAHRAADDRAWAVLAFSQTLLGNYQSAAKAYQQAIASAPSNPWYAHNLGHLLDVALGSPERALPWLRAAYAEKADHCEVAASFVHALGRAGHSAEARRVLGQARERFDSRELAALGRWLDRGAPAREAGTGPGSLQSPGAMVGEGKPLAAPARIPRDKRLARALEQGLSHLPLDARQRDRALRLARDVVTGTPAPTPPVTRRKAEDVAGLAAAVAYAIVYVDHVPLSQAEVAAPFRVGVGRLRGRFAELRAKLDIIRGDARYATR
ncbi:MAG: hypothetical protein JWP97_267 [Labilithrix sp.]|nr:hypothetical protein [Labilithrix sp.]